MSEEVGNHREGEEERGGKGTAKEEKGKKS